MSGSQGRPKMYCVFSFAPWKLTRKVLENSLLEIAETDG